jgi:predicted DNA-binding transcriptional regulator YafY
VRADRLLSIVLLLQAHHQMTSRDLAGARGWKKVPVGFDVEDMACEYAVSFGPVLEVNEPLSGVLRKSLVE